MQPASENNPGSSGPTAAPRKRPWWFHVALWVFVASVAWVAFLLFRGDSNEASWDLKQQLIKAIHDYDGTVVKSMVLKKDDHIGPQPGYGYSGTATLDNGAPARIEVWLEHFFNNQGGGDVMHWTLRKTAPATQ